MFFVANWNAFSNSVWFIYSPLRSSDKYVLIVVRLLNL